MEADNIEKRKSTNNLKIRKTVFVLVGFVFSALGLWYVFHDVDFDELLASADRVRVLPLLGAVALYWCLGIVIRAFLLRHLLSPVGKMPTGKIYRYICIGFLANNVLPLRMGEVVRIAGISRASGIGFASVTGAAAVERLLDMVMAAVVGMAAIQVAPLADGIKLVILASGLGLLSALAVLIFLSRRRLKEIPQTGKRKLKIVVWNLIVRFVAGLGALGTSRGIIGAVALSASIWVVVIGVMALRLEAFGLAPSLPLILVLITSLSLGVALPSAPAYVGVYHACVVGSLTLFGIDQEIAVGFAIFCHLTDLIPACLLGVVTMLMEGVRLADLKEDANTAASQT
jgi:uncharacterized protein (TIRG00374 family)